MDAKLNLEDCKVELRITRSGGAVVMVDLERATLALEADTLVLLTEGAPAEAQVRGYLMRMGGAAKIEIVTG